MEPRKIYRTGLIGSLIAAVCCFTPLLVIILASLGLSAFVGLLDYILLPALALCLAIMLYGLYLRQKQRGKST